VTPPPAAKKTKEKETRKVFTFLAIVVRWGILYWNIAFPWLIPPQRREPSEEPVPPKKKSGTKAFNERMHLAEKRKRWFHHVMFDVLQRDVCVTERLL
jgi:hypothetical protein